MTQRNGATRVFGVIQELQQLRTKVCMLSEKNRELAKALTATKQELTKVRTEQNAVFSDKVVEWMESQYKYVKVQHQATQCNFGELNGQYVSPAFPPLQSDGATRMPYSELPTTATNASSFVRNKAELTSITERDAENPQETNTTISEDNGARPMTRTEVSCSNAMLSPRVNAGLERSQVVKRQLRQRDIGMSYVEPKLNTKLRRGDYYGLGKRTGHPTKTRRSPKARMISGPRRAKSPYVPALFEQQCGNSVRRRTTRSVTHVSYTEPKLNTKLRQGDKFTFTT